MVCTSSKSKVVGGGCCYDKGGEELLAEIQSEIQEQGLRKKFVAKHSACMSNCKQGISVRTFPDRKTYNKFQSQDISSLLPPCKKVLEKK